MSARQVTVWTLELAEADGVVEPTRPEPAGLTVARATEPGTSARLYAAVGGPYEWTDRAHWPRARWAAWEALVETRVAFHDGAEAGYFELRPDAPDSVELAYFGLLQPFHGLGLGGWLLTHALRRGFATGARRAWVQTCSLDGPHALANYEARGLRVVREEQALR